MSKTVPGFVIPDTIEGVAGLLTARRWEKAAIVYAWTTPDNVGGRGNRGNRAKTGTLYGIREFAEFGLAGLSSATTVRAYREAWVWAIEQGLVEPVGPGDAVDFADLDGVEFPPTGNPAYARTEHDDDYSVEAQETGVSTDAAKRAGANKAAVEAAVAADPEVAAAAQRGLDKHWQKRKAKADERMRERAKGEPPADRVVVDPVFAGADKIVGGGVLGEALAELDTEIERDERREWIDGLVKAARALASNIERGVEKFRYTTDPEEIAKVHSIQAALMDAGYKFDEGFIPVRQVRR